MLGLMLSMLISNANANPCPGPFTNPADEITCLRAVIPATGSCVALAHADITFVAPTDYDTQPLYQAILAVLEEYATDPEKPPITTGAVTFGVIMRSGRIYVEAVVGVTPSGSGHGHTAKAVMNRYAMGRGVPAPTRDVKATFPYRPAIIASCP